MRGFIGGEHYLSGQVASLNLHRNNGTLMPRMIMIYADLQDPDKKHRDRLQILIRVRDGSIKSATGWLESGVAVVGFPRPFPQKGGLIRAKMMFCKKYF
jgi:hypothetical protein